MLKRSSILRRLAEAVDGSESVQEIVEQFGGQVRVLMGHNAEEELQGDSRRVTIALSYSDEPYDVGYVATRRAVISARVMVYDKHIEKDDGLEEYVSVLACHDLCESIGLAARAIPVLGDNVMSAPCTVVSDAWPLAVGEINIAVEWPVTLGPDGLEET